MRVRGLIIIACLLAVAACSDDGPEQAAAGTAAAVTATVEATTATDVTEPTADTQAPQPSFAEAEFTTIGGNMQLAVIDAEPGSELTLYSVDAAQDVTTVQADAQGSFLWRSLKTGNYTVRTSGDSPAESVETLVFDESSLPPPGFYAEQRLPAGGFGYITTRDGTTLSANVSLPGPADDGPYPTVVEYSGYTPSDPENTTFAGLFNALGYAYVGVNMRGTGCSGGSYQFFERNQSLDGYDLIEAIAAQPWVFENRVGMVGISYPGISQLFVASTQPPSLAAITPLSVIDDSYRATGFPGGILNTGFAQPFLEERFAEAKIYGQEWAKDQADSGDTTCADNQKLRLQNPEPLTRDNDFNDPATNDPLSPATFVDKITVPTFLAGAWQDEQTGGHFANMLDDFDGTDLLFVDLSNGLHTESLNPTTFARMAEFLDLYVAKKTPDLTAVPLVAAALVPGVFGPQATVFVPEDRFTAMSYEEALAAYEGEPRVRVLFEQGASEDGTPGSPIPRYIAHYDSWPVPQAVATTWYLGEEGLLVDEAPTQGSTDSYVADPTLLPTAFYPGGRSSDIWQSTTSYDWQPIPDGSGLAYATLPLPSDTVMVGGGSLDLWVSSSTADTDLEVTISEVRADGSEVYVQSGWLRASHRALDEAASSELQPVHLHTADSLEPLTPGELTPVRIELFPVTHAFRKGTRIRITVDAPGNSRPVWAFKTISDGETVSIAHDAEHPSKLVLSIVPDFDVPDAAPACGSLRGQPCRPYEPIGNEGRGG